jgi:hypothetical protein
MKNKFGLILLFLILISNFSFSQEKSVVKKINNNGAWKDINSGVQNDVVIIYEQGGKIIFSHYLEWKGQKVVESGTGIRKGLISFKRVI